MYLWVFLFIKKKWKKNMVCCMCTHWVPILLNIDIHIFIYNKNKSLVGLCIYIYIYICCTHCSIVGMRWLYTRSLTVYVGYNRRTNAFICDVIVALRLRPLNYKNMVGLFFILFTEKHSKKMFERMYCVYDVNVRLFCVWEYCECVFFFTIHWLGESGRQVGDYFFLATHRVFFFFSFIYNRCYVWMISKGFSGCSKVFSTTTFAIFLYSVAMHTQTLF